MRFSLIALLAILPAVRGQNVHWDPPGGTLPVGQQAQLQLVFDDCSPDGTPTLPKVNGLSLTYAGQSSNISIINGDMTRTTTLSYAALLTRNQPVGIPPFSVDTSKGRARVAAARFDPAGATVGNSGVALDQVAAAKLTPAPDSVWVGEVFNLDYTIEASHNYYPQFANGAFEWNPAPLTIEDWSQPQQFQSSTGSETRQGLAYRTRGIAHAPGRFRLNPANQVINLSIGVSGFGFFTQREYQQFSVTGNAPTIEVKPLPPAPSGFNGAVGNFRLTSKVTPVQVSVGDPVTWTLELAGHGNWPDIAGLPSREVSKDFQVVQPKPKRVQASGKLFDGTLTEDVVLIPGTPGTYTLAPTEFTSFDPKSGTYQTVTAPGATITVSAPNLPQQPGGSPMITLPTTGAPEAPAAAEVTPPRPPEAPGAIPRDPLPESGPGPRLLADSDLAAGLAAPVVLLVLYWGVLAYNRARRNDPLNPLRDARLRLGVTLGSLKTAGDSDRPALLLAWQRDAAALWKIDHAAPPAQALGDAAWATLWTEADRTLYGPDLALPADWTARAEAVLEAKRVPSFKPARMFLPRNLLPFLAATMMLLVPATRAAGAEAASPAAAPGVSYRLGDFAAAEKGWRRTVDAAPTNRAARHNLSLALSQQDRWGEAAAEAASAFIQFPSNPAVRAQLALACDKAGFVPSALADLEPPTGLAEELATLLSPPEWQWVAVVSAVLAAAALALLLAGSYGALRGRWPAPAGLALLVVAIVAILSSWIGLRAYGIAADSRAVVAWRPGTLRSIPTEADVSQKTTTLPAGSVAVADKAFLGWVRLRFPDGQTGWVRKDEVIGLWR